MRQRLCQRPSRSLDEHLERRDPVAEREVVRGGPAISSSGRVADSATVRCGMTSSKTPPYGGWVGKRAAIAAVSRANGSSGSGREVDDAREATDPGERHLERVASCRRSRRARRRTVRPARPARRNGKRTVTWAGTPTLAARSQRVRSRSMPGGTGTRTIDRAGRLGRGHGRQGTLRRWHQTRHLPERLRRIGKVHHVAPDRDLDR